MDTGRERRVEQREEMDLSVKIYDPKIRRYRTAHTENISRSGAALCIYGAEHIRTGDRVEVAIDWKENGKVVSQSDLFPAIVVRRSVNNDDWHEVAVEFCKKQEVELAA